MRESSPDAWTRAARLVRWYPAEWRNRYGDEFSELLAAQIGDRPRSWARTLDVAFGAIMARLAALGLSGTTVDPSDQPRRSMATLGYALTIFLTFALSIWSHLTIAQRWAAPATTATHTAIIIMTIAVVICVAAAAAGSIPIAWTATRAAARPSNPGLRVSALMFMAGTAILIVGSVAFHNGWSVTGSHPWSQQLTGPGGPAAFLWASTLSVSAYWLHPTILLGLPASEMAWMAISPIALILSVVGGAKTVRQLDLSARLLRYMVHIAHVAIAGLGLFLFGTLTWLVDGGPGPGHLFQAGAVDQVGLVMMTATLIVAIRSIQRTTARVSIAR
jgi:hypothetical protein